MGQPAILRSTGAPWTVASVASVASAGHVGARLLGGPASPNHIVQFYEDDRFLVDIVAGFAGGGIVSGEAVIVVATREHLDAVQARLTMNAIDVGRACGTGQLALFDAHEVLETILVDGMPDVARFLAAVTRMLDATTRARPGVFLRAYGEMVDILFRRGDRRAAVALEGLWNELAREHRLSLLCSYGMRGFASADHAPDFDAICWAHTHVLPADGYAAVADADERLREIATLQQRARALEGEVARRRQLEDELREKHGQLAQANHMKDEFLATLSHELRTPLNAILGWTQAVRGGGLDAATWERALETIERNAKAQARLVDDVLDLSRIVTGKLRIEVRALDLAEPVRAAVETVMPTASAKRIELDVALPAEPVRVAGDPERLQQIAWNLLSNAIKFTPSGGRVAVRIDVAEDDASLVVSDSGQGIAAAFVPHLFERFRQGDGSTTRSHGGLGLGLAIVRQLAEMHGGSVGARSEGEGKGAVFTVTVPRERAALREAPPARPPVPPARPLAGVRVLVVDDVEDTRDLVVLVLERAGAETAAAASALDALSMLQGRPFDVLVSDIGLPGIDGYELLRRVRALPRDRGGDVRAVAFTGYASDEDTARARDAGFERHVCKPIDAAKLLDAIAALAR